MSKCQCLGCYTPQGCERLGHDLSDKVDTVLREHGLTDHPAVSSSDIHSWRCAYPDRYGQCDCFEELVADLVAVLT